ncbi:MAG: 2-isopropylmalate synthase [Clostridia bacterium]
MVMRKIKIFDTTLRDGEQAPGCSMDLYEKLEVARALQKLRVDVIEAGFPISSAGDRAAIEMISREIKDSSVCALARAVEADIDAAAESLRDACAPCIHTFIATSPVHMQYKLRMTPDEVIERTHAAVSYAKRFCTDVEFSAEDAGRSDLDFLVKVLDTAIRAGATTVNIPDTVGYLSPTEIAARIKYLREHVDGMANVQLSVHHHNDLGLATANSLAAISAGATQVECTINGIGERAGNASLEEVVMAIKTRTEFFGADTEIDTKQIYRASRLVSSITGIAVPPNKAIVGQNAFAHEAGIHQHGVMAERTTYEIMRAEDIGIPKKQMVLGKHSGRHAFEARLLDLGYHIDGAELDSAFERFKKLADKKKIVRDRDIETLIGQQDDKSSGRFRLDSFIINSGNHMNATAAIKLFVGETLRENVSLGSGPVDAGFKAINGIVGEEFELSDYSLHSVTEGEDALGEAVVKIIYGGKLITGRGVSTDVIEASLKAYINGVNKALM